MAVTPMRGFRSPDEVWEPAKSKAEADGFALATVVNDLLAQYVAGTVTVTPKPEPQPA